LITLIALIHSDSPQFTPRLLYTRRLRQKDADFTLIALIHSDSPRFTPRLLFTRRLRHKHAGFTLIALIHSCPPLLSGLRRGEWRGAGGGHGDSRADPLSGLARSTPRSLFTRRLRQKDADFTLIALIEAPASMQVALPRRFNGRCRVVHSLRIAT
jgi:hypothetical protein